MKFKNKLQLGVFFVSMLMLTACGGGGGSTAPNLVTPPTKPPTKLPTKPPTKLPAKLPTTLPTTAPTTPVTSQSLEGLWSTPCQASTELTGYDEQQIFNFKGTKLTTNKTFYTRDTNDPQTCKHSDEALRVRITANIELGATVNSGMATVHTKINITNTKVILAPMNSALTALFNDVGHTGNKSIYYGYGKTKWRVAYWANISTTIIPDIKDVRANFKINKSVPDILQIFTVMIDGRSHKVLKLGAQGGYVDSDDRPLSLANNITAFKQNKTIQAQTLLAAGLIGQWKYGCRLAKGSPDIYQASILDFTDSKLKTSTTFYAATDNVNLRCHNMIVYQVQSEAEIAVGKVINKGAANEHTEIGIKTTNIKVNVMDDDYLHTFNRFNFYNQPIESLYYGYDQIDWLLNKWEDISDRRDAIINLDIGAQVPDIFKISTVRTDGASHTELKMGDYNGVFDINGRAMSFEPQGAVFQ